MALRRKTTLGSRKSLLDDISDLDSPSTDELTDDDDQESSTINNHEYLYILAIDRNAHPITINWLIELLKRNGLILAKLGEQTRVEHQLYRTAKTEEILIAVAASERALTDAAKAMKLTPSRPDNVLLSSPIGILFADSIFESDTSFQASTLDSHLTQSEKERCMLYILENIQSDQPSKDVLLGYPSVFVYPGQSIIPVCHREKIITRYFPLHNKSLLNCLGRLWLWSAWERQPINSIRAYFGESIAFYFAFMEFYTVGLVIPALLGIIQFLFFSAKFDAFFSLLSILYLTVLIKIWKRRSSEYAYEWGTLQSAEIQKPRSMFRAKLMYDRNGKAKLTYPIQRTLAKVYLISLPIVILCLFGSLKVMLVCLHLEEIALQAYINDDYTSTIMTALPGVFYAALVWMMNRSYQCLAERLTEYENHRTQAGHDSHLIIKLALFEFVNNFGSVFYIAFYVQDIQQVRKQIGALLLIGQLIENFMEVFVPYLTYYTNIELPLQRRLSTYKKLDCTEDKSTSNKSDFVREAQTQNHKPTYESTYNDYLEIFIQMGYVFMFASVFPLAALFAFINNIIEIKSDSFKLIHIFQRPNARFAKGINPAWMKAFEIIGLLSVLTFSAHIGISSFMLDLKNQLQLNQTQYVLLIVLIEHVTLALILVISYVIPDQPKHIREKFRLSYDGPESDSRTKARTDKPSTD